MLLTVTFSNEQMLTFLRICGEKTREPWKYQPSLTIKDFKKSRVTYNMTVTSSQSWYEPSFAVCLHHIKIQTLSFFPCLCGAHRTAELCCRVISAARLPEAMSLVFPDCRRCPATAPSSQHVARCLHGILTYASAFHRFPVLLAWPFFSSLCFLSLFILFHFAKMTEVHLYLAFFNMKSTNWVFPVCFFCEPTRETGLSFLPN